MADQPKRTKAVVPKAKPPAKAKPKVAAVVRTKHQLTVAWAVDTIGQQEAPLGSNRGPFVEFCQSHTWLKGTGWPWCAAFAVTAVEEGGLEDYPDKTAGAWDLLARARRRGWARGPQYRPAAGDIVVFNIGAGHCGIVESSSPLAVTSIDGNSGDKVSRWTRSRSDVRGFVAWPENLREFKPSKRPRWQLVTSASGTRRLAVGSST